MFYVVLKQILAVAWSGMADILGHRSFVDIATLLVMQTPLFVLFVLAVWKVRMKGKGGSDGKVVRGERSMNSLYVLYGVVTVVFALTVQVADSLIGYKSAIILIDYLLWSYLFFFNSWFRNRIVFRIDGRLRED